MKSYSYTGATCMITIVISAIKIQKLFKIRQKGQLKENGLIKLVPEGD